MKRVAALLLVVATTAKAQNADPLMPSEFPGTTGNPSLVTDRFVLGFMASLVVPPTAEEMAEELNKPQVTPDTQPGFGPPA
ncbi:MAG: hypothetical protein EXR93_05835 [Gemmatimonadetes bacterium]|nr:hypothetical protein [Gemmatimonadota bacterium]